MRVTQHPRDELAHDVLRGVEVRRGEVDAREVAAQRVRPLDEVDLLPGLGELDGRGEPGDAAAEDEGGRAHGHGPLLERLVELDAIDGGARERGRLLRRHPRVVVDPAALLADVGHLHEVRVDAAPLSRPIREIDIPVLIIGGGPAGLSAGIELGKRGIRALIVDDKHRLGGKLVLQTHRFFGSANMVYAGTRGIDIATKLEKELGGYPSIEVWLHSTALAVFSDQKIGVAADFLIAFYYF